LTAASANGANFWYATDFHNGKVDVFDASFQKVQLDGQFQDPNLAAGFGPFGIQAIGNDIFVTFAKQNATASAQIVGVGGTLNAPWGVAQAPANFGPLSNDMLVGNFGDGTIEAFDPNTGRDLGKLVLTDGTPFTQMGLWGISFGNGVDNQPTNTLFYAAGPSKTTGVFGRIDLSN
jgi:hypothetical protein